jgi:hypothetical protein
MRLVPQAAVQGVDFPRLIWSMSRAPGRGRSPGDRGRKEDWWRLPSTVMPSAVRLSGPFVRQPECAGHVRWVSQPGQPGDTGGSRRSRACYRAA